MRWLLLLLLLLLLLQTFLDRGLNPSSDGHEGRLEAAEELHEVAAGRELDRRLLGSVVGHQDERSGLVPILEKNRTVAGPELIQSC